MYQFKKMKITKNIILTASGIIIGAIAGYLYWQQVGCASASGTCAITSKPVNSTLYGSMMGGLLFSMLHKKENK